LAEINLTRQLMNIIPEHDCSTSSFDMFLVVKSIKIQNHLPELGGVRGHKKGIQKFSLKI
jgi:hypothetical protein